MEALETDMNCRRLTLAHRLENVACTFEGEETSACWPRQSPDPLLPRKMAPWFNAQRARTCFNKYIMSIFKVSRFTCNKGQFRDIRSVWACAGMILLWYGARSGDCDWTRTYPTAAASFLPECLALWRDVTWTCIPTVQWQVCNVAHFLVRLV